jgi:hypothetical protein
MKGASNVALGLLDILLSPAPFPGIGASPQSSISSQDSQGPLPFNEDEVTLKFIMGIYTWFDITSCVAVGSSPFLAQHYERLLGGVNPPLRMEKYIGIQNWVMIFIGKIASLDAWKRTSQSSGTLSIIELVKKVTQLETELKQALDDFSKDCENSATLEQAARRTLPHLAPLSVYSNYLTEVYASSALTYLHVVVSGPYPDLPDIRETVCKTMEMIKKLPNPAVPRCMWWPLLITGGMAGKWFLFRCLGGVRSPNHSFKTTHETSPQLHPVLLLATLTPILTAVGDEQVLCRNVILGSGANSSSLGTGYNILKVLEECWREQGTNDHVFLGDGYWGDVMHVYSPFIFPNLKISRLVARPKFFAF